MIYIVILFSRKTLEFILQISSFHLQQLYNIYHIKNDEYIQMHNV